MATSRSCSAGDSGDHLRPKTMISSGAAVEVSCVLLIDSVNFEGEYTPTSYLCIVEVKLLSVILLQ